MRCAGYEMERYKGTQASHREINAPTMYTPLLADASTVLDATLIDRCPVGDESSDIQGTNGFTLPGVARWLI